MSEETRPKTASANSYFRPSSIGHSFPSPHTTLNAWRPLSPPPHLPVDATHTTHNASDKGIISPRPLPRPYTYPRHHSSTLRTLLHLRSSRSNNRRRPHQELPPAAATKMGRAKGESDGPGGELLLAHGDDAGDVGVAGAVFSAAVSTPPPPPSPSRRKRWCIAGSEPLVLMCAVIDTRSTTPSKKAPSRPASEANTPCGATRPAKNAA